MTSRQKFIVFIFFILISHSVNGTGHGDFRNLSFTEAFDSLFVNLSACYPFTEWKTIDWQELYSEYAPQIEFAQGQADTNAFKLAVRRFIHSFPDGHVRVSGKFDELFINEIGGGLGLTLVELNDGSVVVNRVLSGSPAELEGVGIGATIIQWNGLPVTESLMNAEIIWKGKPPATSEAIRLAQLRRLIRGSIGSQVEITYMNPGENTVTKTLTAVDDGMATWEITNYSKFSTNGSFNITIEDILNPVQYSIFPSGYGYLKCRILVEFDSQGNILTTYDNINNSIKESVDYFNAAQVPGVIIDVRDNPGDYDKLAAVVGGYFYDHSELYEHASFYNPQTGVFEVIGSFTINLEPQTSYYGGPALCLVNTGTASSSEGVPMAVQRLAQGHVIGFQGTSASFGLTSGETKIPGGLKINYPLGRSLDKNYHIQLDSDSTKTGGVIPDIQVPLTMDNMIAKFVDSVDVELNYAVEYLNSITSVYKGNPSQPERIRLYTNFFNPFNLSTTIKFDLPKATKVVLKITRCA